MKYHIYIYIYIYIYIESSYGNKSDSIKKLEIQSLPNMMNSFMMVKSMLKCFGFIKPSSGLYDGEKIVAWTTIDVFIEITGAPWIEIISNSILSHILLITTFIYI